MSLQETIDAVDQVRGNAIAENAKEKDFAKKMQHNAATAIVAATLAELETIRRETAHV